MAHWRRLVGLVGATLAVAQQVATFRDARRFPAPGHTVDIGGARLHLLLAGDAEDGPTVVLEAGLGSFSPNWFWVQSELAATHRVVAYDRAGLGWSGAARGRRDVVTLADELHQALHAAGVPGPYVLAGHSFGGLVVRAFAGRFPAEVVGLALVDASHPDQWARWPLHGADWLLAGAQSVTAVLAAFGLLRVLDPIGSVARGLPDARAAELRARTALPRTSATEARQMVAWHRHSRAQVNAARPLGSLPLFVLSVTEQPRGDAILTELQAELRSLSQNVAWTVVEGATHESLVADPVHAHVVADGIRHVITAAQDQAVAAALQQDARGIDLSDALDGA